MAVGRVLWHLLKKGFEGAADCFAKPPGAVEVQEVLLGAAGSFSA